MDYRRNTDSSQSIKCYATLENPKSFPSKGINKLHTHNDLLLGNQNITTDVKDKKGELQITAIGEASLSPTRAKFKVAISSCKGNLSDAEASTNRRSEYVIQTLRNNGLKDDSIDISNSVNRLLKLDQSEKSKFEIRIEIVVHFTDFKKCETLRNFLVSKLDESVYITGISYLHDPARASNLRRVDH